MRIRLRELQGSPVAQPSTQAALTIGAQQGLAASQEPIAGPALNTSGLSEALSRLAGIQRDEDDDAFTETGRAIQLRIQEQNETFEQASKAVLQSDATPARIRSKLGRMFADGKLGPEDHPGLLLGSERVRAEYNINTYRNKAEAALRERVPELSEVSPEQLPDVVSKMLQESLETHGGDLEGAGYFERQRINELLPAVHADLVEKGRKWAGQERDQRYRYRLVDLIKESLEGAMVAETPEEFKAAYKSINAKIDEARLDRGVEGAAEIAMFGGLAAAANVERQEGPEAAAEYLEEYLSNVGGAGQGASILAGNRFGDRIESEIAALERRGEQDRRDRLMDSRYALEATQGNILKPGSSFSRRLFEAQTEGSTALNAAIREIQQDFLAADGQEAWLEANGLDAEDSQNFLRALNGLRSSLGRGAAEATAGDVEQFKASVFQLSIQPGPHPGGKSPEDVAMELLMSNEALHSQGAALSEYVEKVFEPGSVSNQAMNYFRGVNFEATAKAVALELLDGVDPNEDIEARRDFNKYADAIERDLVEQAIQYAESLELRGVEQLDQADILRTWTDMKAQAERKATAAAKPPGAPSVPSEPQGIEETARDRRVAQQFSSRSDMRSRDSESILGLMTRESYLNPEASVDGPDAFGLDDLEDRSLRPLALDTNQGILEALRGSAFVKTFEQRRLIQLERVMAAAGGSYLGGDSQIMRGVYENPSIPRSVRAKAVARATGISGALNSDAVLVLMNAGRSGEAIDAEEFLGALGVPESREVTRNDVTKALEAIQEVDFEGLNPFSLKLYDYAEATEYVVGPTEGAMSTDSVGIEPSLRNDPLVQKARQILALSGINPSEENVARFFDSQQLNWKSD